MTRHAGQFAGAAVQPWSVWLTSAACWAHVRRKLFKLAEVAHAPLAAKAVRQQDIAPLVTELESWMRETRAQLSQDSVLAKSMNDMLTRWEAFSRFLSDGRICLTNNAIERALRGIALGRKSWLFAGSDRGGERTAAMYLLIVTAKLKDVDPRAWLADVPARIADHPASRLQELPPWKWMNGQAQQAAAA